MSLPTSTLGARHRHRVLLAFGAAFAALVCALFVASYFLDDAVRTRTELTMNQKLRGYHVSLGHAHLQLLGGRLTLRNLEVVQEAHPSPPVAFFPIMRFHIEWKELLERRIVAETELWHPKVRIDRSQLAAEARSKVPLKQKGWQDALESVYPFKINRFAIEAGDVVYIQDRSSKPLHLANINFVTDNIRNIRAAGNDYPSKFHSSLVIFGTGRATIDGHANYLEEPAPGVRAKFRVENVPLSAFDPEIREVNLAVNGGHLSAEGLAEYSPKVARVEVGRAAIDGVDATYVHLPSTRQAEAHRVEAAGKAIEEQNNRPAVELRMSELDIRNSKFTYVDRTTDPGYQLFLTDSALTLKNLSNHGQQGPAQFTLAGKFMGSGDTQISGDYLSGASGPALNLDAAIEHTDLASMNDLLRAYGRFDVAAGKFSVFTSVAIKNGDIKGSVKPLFADVEVYNYEKDKRSGMLHQAKELLIGGASRVLTNWRTQRLATRVDLSGKLTDPQVSTWQALVEVLRNAFVQAILPGFDRSVQPASGRLPTHPQSRSSGALAPGGR